MLEKMTPDNTAWTVREELGPGFLESLRSLLKTGTGSSEGILLKDNTVRSAFLLKAEAAPCSSLFVKRYKCRGFGDRAKHFFLPSKALSEWRTLLYFEQSGLPCPRPLAFAEQRSFRILRHSCLVLEGLPDAVPLGEYADAGGGTRSGRSALARKLAGLVALLHRSNVFYRDLHAGNILLRPTDAQDPELFFIDLHRAVVLPRMFEWMRVSDLAQLCNSLPACAADRTAFMQQYCLDSGLSRTAYRRLLEKTAARRRKLERRRILSRSKRCLKNSTVFQRSRTWRETLFCRREFGMPAARSAAGTHAADTATGRPGVVKASSKSDVTVQAGAGGNRVCVKGYRFLGLPYCLKNSFRKSRARKNWIAANRLLVRGMETPLPLAMLERRWGPFVVRSFFITEWLEEAQELNSRIQSLETDAKKDFIRQFALVLRRLHEQGIYHADLKSNNILVSGDGAGGWHFYFIDLDRVAFRKSLSFYQRANNLAQINASVARIITAKDRLRFFRVYALGSPCFQERKRYYRKILEISRTKITGPYGITFS